MRSSAIVLGGYDLSYMHALSKKYTLKKITMSRFSRPFAIVDSLGDWKIEERNSAQSLGP